MHVPGRSPVSKVQSPPAEALKWLDTAMRLRSPELSDLKEEHT